MSIKTKITLWYLLVVIVLTVLFGLMAYFLLADSLSRNTMNPWDMKIAEIQPLSEGQGRVAAITEIAETSGEGRYNILSMTGTRLLELASPDGTIEVRLPQVAGNDSYSIILNRDMLTENGAVSADDIRVHIYFSGYEASDVKLIVTTRSQPVTDLVLGGYRMAIIVSALITLAVAGLLGFFIVRWQFRPLTFIIEWIKGNSRKTYRHRFGVHRKDEAGELAEALNRLFTETEEHVSNEHRITADISHELRTPLAVAQAEASLALTRERDSEEYRTALGNVSREILHLSSIVDKLLFLARSESNGELNVAYLDLNELLAEVVESAEILCELKDQQFLYDSGADGDTCFIRGDRFRLKELFLNLIDNAVNYTPEKGTIGLTLKKQGEMAVICVQDNGIGISEEHIPYIFNRFYRIDNPGESSRAGSGLGLAICRRIVQLHKGEISVRSTPGEGSSFTVRLPLESIGK